MGRLGPAIQRDEAARTWRKYCGFFDLSLAEFMEIQGELLREQLFLVSASQLGRKIMGERQPSTIAEFQSTVPITTYADYQPYLSEKREDVLAEKPCWWAYTSGQPGSSKWVPYTHRAADRMLDALTAAVILASAPAKGQANISRRLKAVFNLPPRPYLSGYLTQGMAERLDLQLMPPLDTWEQMEFEERIETGFKMALREGVDIIGSMSSVLLKIGEGFADRSRKVKFSSSMLHPQVLGRIARAIVLSKVHRRPRLPRDLWSPQCVICWGTDTSIYKRQLLHYWGKEPYEFYGRTETGILALQAWNRWAMTLLPYNGFFEFIPEEAWLRARNGSKSALSAVPLNEVEPGHRYLLVVTSFYGMPFLRYMVGDIVRIVALRDKEAGIELPQMVYEGRVDDLIDIAGFTRLDEKTVWQAIANTRLPYEDWTIRKEYNGAQPILNLYIELKEERGSREVASLVHEQLKCLDHNYLDMERMLGLQPLKVTLLSRGTFRRYYQEKLAARVDLGQLKPPHMNATDAKVRSDLQVIQQAALDGADTVRRLQDFARVRVDRESNLVDPNPLVETALSFIEPRRREREETGQGAFNFVLSLGRVGPVYGASGELRQVLTNIMLNAMDAMPQGGTLSVKTQQQNGMAVISVADTGAGIPPEIQGKVFDPFFTTKGPRGTGLGLSVAYGIIRRHGGAIDLVSTVGQGTTFYVRLPLASASAPATAQPASHNGVQVMASAEPQTAPASGSADILVIDDDPAVAEVLRLLLQQKGYQVAVAASGEDGLAAFRGGEYRLVIADMGLPKMSGAAVATEVKKTRPDTPVVLITGWGVQLDPKGMERAGVSTVVSKPFVKEDIYRCVAQLLGTSG